MLEMLGLNLSAGTVYEILNGVYTFLSVGSIVIVFVAWFRLRRLLTVPIRVAIFGGEMGILTRGPFMLAHYIPPRTKETEMKDNDGKTASWGIRDDGVKMFEGIASTLMIDNYPGTFAADEMIGLAADMTNTHLNNLRTGLVIEKDEKGQTIRQTFKIDPESPNYDLPKFFSSQNLAEQIQIKAARYAKQERKKDMRAIYVGGGIAIAAIGVVFAIKLMDYKVAADVIASTTTTLIQATTTTLAQAGGSPPPMI